MDRPRYSTNYPELGHALVFVNENFQWTRAKRTGAKKDVTHYDELFQACGLKVHIYKDLTRAETMQTLRTCKLQLLFSSVAATESVECRRLGDQFPTETNQ